MRQKYKIIFNNTVLFKRICGIFYFVICRYSEATLRCRKEFGMTYNNPIPNIDNVSSNSNRSEVSICESCGKESIVVSTSFTGSYCKECLKLVIFECKEAIKEIDSYGKSNKVNRTTTKLKTSKEELEELERKKDEALEKLMTSKFY